jgi:hypothetical protein
MSFNTRVTTTTCGRLADLWDRPDLAIEEIPDRIEQVMVQQLIVSSQENSCTHMKRMSFIVLESSK